VVLFARLADMATWGGFRESAPELADFGAARLLAAPAYLATIRRDGSPRVHPVSPVITGMELLVFMEPDSPKGHDLRLRRSYSMHNAVSFGEALAGEFVVFGEAEIVVDPVRRAAAEAAATYETLPRYVLYELSVVEARSNIFGDETLLPSPRRWADAGHTPALTTDNTA
jgi:hypothetical protein